MKMHSNGEKVAESPFCERQTGYYAEMTFISFHISPSSSSSVYLLFYKKTKTHDAETCTRGIINNGSLPVTRDETAVTDGEEGEKGIEVGGVRTAEDISMGIDRPVKRVEDQDDGARQQSNNQGWKDESSHLCGYPLAEKPMQDKEDLVKDDQEGGQTEAEEQAAQRELSLTNNQLKDRVKDQDFGEAGKYHTASYINHELKPETSDKHDHLNKDDKTSEKRGEGSVLDAHTEKQKQNEGNALKDSEDGGHTGADERREESRIEDRDVGDTGNNGGIHKRPDTNCEFKADSSDRSATHDHRNKGDEMSEERVKDQDSNDESRHSHESDLEALKQKEVNILKDDEEADEQVGEDQDFSSAQTDDVKLETSHTLARPEHVCEEDEMREVQRGVLNLKMPRVESSQGDVEETKEKTSLENLVKMVDKEKGEIEVKDDRDRQTGAHQHTLRKRQYFSRYDLCYPTAIEDKRRALEKMELDDEDDQEGMTEGDRQTTASKPLLTKYDLCYQSLQYITGVGDSERQKRSEEARLSDRHEQQRQQRRDRNRGKEQSRREDEPAQRKETSTTKRGLSASLEDENEREVDDFKLNKPEQQISVSNTKHESVSAEEKTTQRDSKPKERSGCKEVTEGGGGSGIYCKIIEEDIMKTPGGNQISMSKTIRMRRVGETEETQTEQD
uniref:trichohyalin-like isoform X1 n=1 Tax=Solea senegalensis TaxID=28829 RepID=UPI001CD8B828|nr:trichohyalin-like isoform X1 [Solea senegalensis]